MSDHPEELLALYPDLLGEADRERVEGHLQQCEACRERVAHLTTVARASRALPELKPSPELDRRARQRMLDEARAHARAPRRWSLVVVPLAAAALVAAALLLRPPEPTVDPLDEWTAKGEGEPSGDAELQVAVVVAGGTRTAKGGDHVPGRSALLLGGVLPPAERVWLFLVHDGERDHVYEGALEASEGGAWLVDGAPLTAEAPPAGPFRIELWIGVDVLDADLADRLDLFAEEP